MQFQINAVQHLYDNITVRFNIPMAYYQLKGFTTFARTINGHKNVTMQCYAIKLARWLSQFNRFHINAVMYRLRRFDKPLTRDVFTSANRLTGGSVLVQWIRLGQHVHKNVLCTKMWNYHVVRYPVQFYHNAENFFRYINWSYSSIALLRLFKAVIAHKSLAQKCAR